VSSSAAKEAFVFHQGPVFSQVLLADEINRAGPKTQSALLEAMEEQQVSVENETRPLPHPFFVIATQNPSDQLGTYPLPESQLDRFLLRITLGYPDRASERLLLAGADRRQASARLQPVMQPAELEAAQQLVLQVHASDSLLDYLQALIAASRSGQWFIDGLSPRAGIAVLRVARARAMMAGATTWRPTTCRPSCRRPSRTVWCRWPAPAAARSSRCARWSRPCPFHELAGVAARAPAQRWWLQRLPLTDSWTLSQRNIYIVPTKAGVVFALTLLLMLLASINYQLNLGYALTFLLAGSGLVSMHLTHGTLRGLTLHLRPTPAVFAGDAGAAGGRAHQPRRRALRRGPALRGPRAHGSSFAWCDVPNRAGQRPAVARAAARGVARRAGHDAETGFPFGLFRAWTIWRPAATCWPTRARTARRHRCRRRSAARRAARCSRTGRAASSTACAPGGAATACARCSWKKVARSGETGQPRHRRRRRAAN
jgi:hypothetical protein